VPGLYTDDIRIRLTREQKEFVESKKHMSQYVRFLIDREMKRERPELSARTLQRIMKGLV